jgi:hypothetical protein
MARLIFFILFLALPSTAFASDSPFDFASCEAAGNTVQELYPRRCVTADGKYFTESINFKNSNANVGPGGCVDRCGNAVCEEIVCMGSGCPCPESRSSCPADCH